MCLKSEIIANIKNPNETLEQFCKRLAEEKLKTPKETLDQKQKRSYSPLYICSGPPQQY